ncbi:MAG: hypothetical protein Q7U54_07075 [Bacteroidales bacterium]|nr:hypothetical protein [Bacteroidales bacterium]
MKSRMYLKILITFCVLAIINNISCLPDDPDDECTQNRNSISKSGELLVDGVTFWQISVANQNGAVLDADKNCHAQMQLEFCFKNKELAKTNVKPPILIVFFGGGGFFDPGSVAVYSKQISDGSYLWTAYCDQAAKNASENPTDFGISVSWDPNQLLSLEDVKLDGSINYRAYQQE